MAHWLAVMAAKKGISVLIKKIRENREKKKLLKLVKQSRRRKKK